MPACGPTVNALSPGSVKPQQHSRPRHTRSLTKRQLARALYDWATWGFLVAMIGSQFAGIVWNSTTTDSVFTMGRNPLLGVYNIIGTNDIPYDDRAIVCVQEGNAFRPMLLSKALDPSKNLATVVNDTGVSIDGYRVVDRGHSGTGTMLDSSTYDAYSNTCNVMAATLSGIFDTCSTLEYNLPPLVGDSGDYNLRVVDGLQSERTLRLSNVLPVLVLPYSDNSLGARFAIPGLDGSACVFHLGGKYTDATKSVALMRAPTRSGREAVTVRWLRKPGGAWRNGWYEDPSGTKWYADVVAGALWGTDDADAAVASVEEIRLRSWDILQRQELKCPLSDPICGRIAGKTHWGTSFATKSFLESKISVAIGDGSGRGLFWFQANLQVTLTSVYDWQTFVANGAIGMLLVRWGVSMLTLHYSYWIDLSPTWHGAGLGCVSNANSFKYLPLTLLPRLQLTLAAFWSVGCQFEGAQSALAETWFAMYPSIATCLLLYYSLLDILAKAMRRQISDALFAPSVIFLSAMHFFRFEIAISGLFGIDGRVVAVVFSDEVRTMKLYQFFTSDLAWRLNGNATILIAIKMTVLGLNLLPLLFSRPLRVLAKPSEGLSGVEQALGVCASNVGGLGTSVVYIYDSPAPSTVSNSAVAPLHSKRKITLTSFELLRLGYVVYGGRYVLSLEDWDVVSSMILLRSFQHLWNHRVLVFEVQSSDDLSGANGATEGGGCLVIARNPEMMRLDDRRLLKIPF
ncbi:hypothetical protein BBJ28_00009407 [Nothophytophthora sp. Chile5]|nr:hypothetical protein BBJ28_00009407 [Nothophytophthora sp. Chile5]